MPRNIIDTPRYYVLDGHTPVPVDAPIWVVWYQTFDRVVAETVTKHGVRISTVFMGIDQQHLFHGPPLTFETLVIGGWQWGEKRLYSTWEEAEAGHLEVVALAEARLN